MGIETAALLSSAAINTGISLGLSLIGSWISPKKANVTPEGIPLLGSGNPLYYCWGSTFCPTQIFYVVPPYKAGHNDEYSSYGVLGFANPDTSAELLALRVNDYIVSSNDVNFPLNLPSTLSAPSGKKGSSGSQFYTNGYGIKTYRGLDYQMQLGSTVVNDHFQALNFGDLRYQGLTWLSLRKAERKYYGGSNARIVKYVKNKITSTDNQAFNINFDAPVTVQITFQFSGNFTSIWWDMPFNFPRGFYGTRVIRRYTWDEGYSIMVVGGYDYWILKRNVPAYQNIYYKVLSPVIPGANTTPFGNPSIQILPRAQENQGIVTSAVIGIEGQPMISVNLTNPGLSPIRSGRSFDIGGTSADDNKLFDSNNVQVGVVPIGYVCYGWNNKIFEQDPHYPVIGGNLITNSLPTDGARLDSKTTLQTIISEMISSKRGDSNNLNVLFLDQLGGTLPPIKIRGYSATLDDVKNLIINLCTGYNLLIDEFSIPGTIIFKEYPDGNTIVKTFGIKDYLDEPQFEYSPDISQPNQVELAYRGWESQFSEKTLTVGYGNPYPNKQSYRLDLVLTELEARVVAWTMLFITSHTNTSVKIRVEDISNVTIGSVINVTGNINPSGNLQVSVNNNPLGTIKMLVIGIDVGADNTYQLSCINFIDIYKRIKGTSAEKFSDYMLGLSGTVDGISNIQVSNVSRYLVSAERTIPFGNEVFLYTSESGAYISFDSYNAQTQVKAAVTGGYTGFVSIIESLTGNINTSLVSVTVTSTSTFTPDLSGYLRIGKSWVKYGSWVKVGQDYQFLGVRIGMFGSYPEILFGDKVIQIPVDATQNNVPGSRVDLTSISPSKANQGNIDMNLLARQPDVSFPAGLQIGQVSAEHPYGEPFRGMVIASLMSSNHQGIFKVWVGEPGSTGDVNFFLNTPTINKVSIYKNFWVKPDNSVAINLGILVAGYNEVVIPVFTGNYTVYTRDTNGVNYPAGSNSWRG